MAGDIIVLKFGSSVPRSRADLPSAVHEIYRWYRSGWRVITVVSAIGETTEALLRDAGPRRYIAPGYADALVGAKPSPGACSAPRLNRARRLDGFTR